MSSTKANVNLIGEFCKLKNCFLRKPAISRNFCDFRQRFFFLKVRLTNPRRWGSILTFYFRWSVIQPHWRPVEPSHQEKVGFWCPNTNRGSTGRHENNFVGNLEMCSFPTPNSEGLSKYCLRAVP